MLKGKKVRYSGSGKVPHQELMPDQTALRYGRGRTPSPPGTALLFFRELDDLHLIDPGDAFGIIESADTAEGKVGPAVPAELFRGGELKALACPGHGSRE